jgi:predicted nuclease of predicted toxin-antitoxin system
VKIRFQADADLNEEIVAGVVRQEPDIDFQTATEANLHGLPDEEVLAYAAHETRILVTHDRRTMPAHFANFIVNQTSPGAFIISQKTSMRDAISNVIVTFVSCCAGSGRLVGMRDLTPSPPSPRAELTSFR